MKYQTDFLIPLLCVTVVLHPEHNSECLVQLHPPDPAATSGPHVVESGFEVETGWSSVNCYSGIGLLGFQSASVLSEETAGLPLVAGNTDMGFWSGF